ncbi:hypothetical protein CKM354_000726000 [Cercospora kikuchii]|uniref:Zn(2)-C6 fungal-type domain-containing protein n=1 Tax=Cercospora kikuchii TaxID=84275 RepID=A0A9P3CJT7_9PEZI|nr:uncharacterized protein CKM354_000726000 [Cercospora kikuchii]GIZ44051.1 hypothetical protein CKM354_000726000 [Cercospora kikuchii]
MVYRGRLGRGCAECRARKTRCDQARPACGQCKRADRKCTGYQDVASLRVVDQTRDVHIRASKASSGGLSASSRVSHSSPSDGVDFGKPYSQAKRSAGAIVQFSQSSTLASPAYHATIVAANLFFERYVSVWLAHSKNELDFVAPLYIQAKADSMLSNVVTALGLASLSTQQGDRTLAVIAGEKYSKSLCQVQKSLQDPRLAQTDETVATVILLGLYELVDSGGNSKDGQRLLLHLTGAVQLMQLRGKEAILGVEHHMMYQRVASQIELCCLHERQRIPTALLKLEKPLRSRFHAEEVMTADLMYIAARLCEVLTSTRVVDPAAILMNIDCLVAIEGDLNIWFNRRSPRFHAERLPLRNPGEKFLEHKDVYQNDIGASVMNRYRCIRIAANEEIVRLLEMEFELTSTRDNAQRLNHALACILAVSEDIAYSLPYFFGDDSGLRYPTVHASEGRPLMYSGLSCLMPIYLASNPERVSNDMFRWTMRHLEIIAYDIGIPQARSLLAERLAFKPEWPICNNSSKLTAHPVQNI